MPVLKLQPNDGNLSAVLGIGYYISPIMTSEAQSLLTNENVPVSYNDDGFHIPMEKNETDDRSSNLDDDDEDAHLTETFETFLHLVKGYMGAGCLSLPWAVSQLGVLGGVFSIILLSLWSSYNCWIVVRLKRFMVEEQQTNTNNDIVPFSSANSESDIDEAETSSKATSNVTYPDVGEWAYGASFQQYVTICICTQQLAICTVFVSFVGENLLAVFLFLNISISHTTVMSLALPFIMGLSLIPSLKRLAPVMAAGFFLLLFSLAALGVIVEDEWEHRPETTPAVNPPQIPLALCAILYSYEGINLILPVESVMKKPQDFAMVFTASMAVVAFILASVAILCVLAFGNVTSGSVTAFLLDVYKDDPSVTSWIMVANTAVSLSVLLTYPIQIFPAVELLGPMMRDSKICQALMCITNDPQQQDDDGDNHDLSAFEPLPPLPEHDVVEDEDFLVEHTYMDDPKDGDADDDASFSAVSSIADSIFPKLNAMPGDSVQLRVMLVLSTFIVAVIVPNVQALISLAGAVAGSSTALLIPPVLELAWMQHLEQLQPATVPTQATMSPYMTRMAASNKNDEHSRFNAAILKQWFSEKYWPQQLKCYVLLLLGFIFMLIGTYASILDIVNIYLGQ